METILKESNDKKSDSIYLKIIINGKSKDSIDKTEFYLDITNDLDKIISERYVMDLDKDKCLLDLKDFYKFLTTELRLKYFLKKYKSLSNICLELEGELYAENMNIYEFKRYVVFEWSEIIKLGYIFFRLNNEEVKRSIGSEFIRSKKSKIVEGDW